MISLRKSFNVHIATFGLLQQNQENQQLYDFSHIIKHVPCNQKYPCLTQHWPTSPHMAYITMCWENQRALKFYDFTPMFVLPIKLMVLRSKEHHVSQHVVR